VLILSFILDLYRGINEFKKWHQPRINIIKDDNGNLIAYQQSVLNGWKNSFNQVLNVHGVHDIKQMVIHTAEPLVPETKFVEVENAIGKLESYKFPGTDQILVEFVKAGVKHYILRYRLISSMWNKEELPQQWKESIIVPIYKKADKTDCNNYREISLLSNAYKILSKIFLARLTPYVNEVIGDHQYRFRRNRSTTDQNFYIRQILEKNGHIMGRCISYL
jgi:hypothetical protein